MSYSFYSSPILFSLFSHLSHQTASAHLSSSLLPWPCETPWWILASHPHFKGMKIQTGLCHPVYSAPPFICLDKKCKALRRLPHESVWGPPSGNVCWSFQVSCQTRERDGEGEIKLELKCERARDSDRETTSRARREETGHVTGWLRTVPWVALVLLFSEDTLGISA